MAGTSEEEEEERALETELELHLHEQRDSLASLNQSLISDPSNSELLEVSEELIVAIKEAEEGLFNLKRARLLRECDSVLVRNDVAEIEEEQSYVVGSKCRFRHTDGRWYDGQVVAIAGSSSATISFLTPTSENMLMCKFFLQQRCRFGTYCRSFHGIDIPISALKKYVPTVWENSLVGSSILAVNDSTKDDLWREAELEFWDNSLNIAKVVFRDDGSSANLGTESITLSERNEMSHGSGSTSGDESSSSDLDDDDEEEDEEEGEEEEEEEDQEGSLGLGFSEKNALRRGIQRKTVVFAKWENHTRGVASKIMANMGYRAGMGLGASGQGMVDPIPVRVLQARQSLDLAVEKNGEGNKGKKRSRGGRRKRDKKFASLVRAAKEKEERDEEIAPDVFSVINSQLARHAEKTKKSVVAVEEGKNGKVVDRRSLVAYNHEVKDLRSKVVKLEEMANRNKREKVVYEAAMRKLTETRRELANVEAAHASASNQIVNRENEKKWLKF